MMEFELSILSIFRQSSSYLSRYFVQIDRAFQEAKGSCHSVWLEGDSSDDTYLLLKQKKDELEKLGHKVSLIKFDLNKPYWPSIKHPERWVQLATCWNKCMEYLEPSKITVCVESDLIWDSSVIWALAKKIDDDHPVIAPMLLLENSLKKYGKEWFYDRWGFSRGGHKFRRTNPYWKKNPTLKNEKELLEVSTAGGMLVSTYKTQKVGWWDKNSCIMNYPPHTDVFLDKTLKIYHPMKSSPGKLRKYVPAIWKIMTPILDKIAMLTGYEKR